MTPIRRLLVCLLTAASLTIPATPAFAISPRNPYRSFNLSGVNYGSMQWERAQRKRSWTAAPSGATVPTRRSGRRR